eukprot:CAMPEP_0172617140 /NCGR_PEP_ID=MMETSP1068-20121228/70059_1 /TAXON_ID=35684 /ORGANISM="Pseudopedinella elastica, Strain CCMP716" /LENGTH=46 /DNA_ID= /DNA_START= /DNA_END= /DNA_ORIENTATION=
MPPGAPRDEGVSKDKSSIARGSAKNAAVRYFSTDFQRTEVLFAAQV